MTEFVVERTITFHITTRSARATSFVLEIGASLVQYRHKQKRHCIQCLFCFEILFPRICAGFEFYLTFIEFYCKIVLNSLTI